MRNLPDKHPPQPLEARNILQQKPSSVLQLLLAFQLAPTESPSRVGPHHKLVGNPTSATLRALVPSDVLGGVVPVPGCVPPVQD